MLHIEIFMCVYAHISIHTYIALLCQLKEPQSNKTPAALSTTRAQILISNTILQLKELDSLDKKVVTRTGEGNIQYEPGTSCRK